MINDSRQGQQLFIRTDQLNYWEAYSSTNAWTMNGDEMYSSSNGQTMNGNKNGVRTDGQCPFCV